MVLYDDGLMVFIIVFLLSLGLFLVIAGAFTAYFGSGKSRKIGGGLLVLGIIIGFLVFYLDYAGYMLTAPNGLIESVIIPSIVIILSFVVGAVVAIGLFLLAIMKS
ncbi:MAG: hypothetical protein KAI64_00610 [Thermoplasmata archaeon]|nr:hypothetical protein [Thermoplasmata archaeon]